MNTESEIQLSDDLRHLVAGHSFGADPDALIQRGRRAQRRSLATRGAAGIGVLAVAAAGTVIGVHAGSSGTPQVQDASFVVKQVTAALAKDADYIYRIIDHGEGTVWYQDQTTMNQYWIYGTGDTRTVAWDSSPVVDHYVHLLDTTVNYKDHTYSTNDQKLPGYVAGAEPQESSFVDRIKQSISTGRDTIVGTGQYEGHQVIKLGYTVQNQYSEMWVDSTTYQPVYLITEQDGRRDTSDLAFLPRTPDLVHEMTTPQIPAGFTEVDDALDGGPGHGG